MKIYTKKGDKGTTSLIGGKTISKSDLRIQAYGSVDELNSFVGFAVSFIEDNEIKSALNKIQNELFAIGAQLADPNYNEKTAKGKTIINEDNIIFYENMIDKFEAETGPIQKFILPGGSKGAAIMHILRTVARRCERDVVSLSSKDPTPENIIKYLNRINDFFFSAARVINKRAGHNDVIWE